MNKIFKNLRGQKNKIRSKKGWTLVELCIAMIALAILVGLSVQAIKPRRLMITPFAYAGLQNLRQANNYIINKCNEGEVYGCSSNTGKLPDSIEAQGAMMQDWISNNALPEDQRDPTIPTAEPGPNLSNMNDIYCYEVANLFTLINDEVHCKYNNGGGDDTMLPEGSTPGRPNFQTANMVAYYFLERPWKKIMRATPMEGSDMSMQTTEETYVKQIFIDVNGDDGPNKLGEDQFPLRVYMTGEIIPGACGLYKAEYDPISTDPDIITEADLFCPDGVTSGSSMASNNWLNQSYPFSYNVYRSHVPDISDPETRKTTTLIRGASYRTAACKSGRDVIVPREDFCDTDNDGENFETELNAKNFKTLQDCSTGTEGENAFCVTRISRPSSPGIFRLPLSI